MDPIVQGLAGGIAAVSLSSDASRNRKLCFWTGVIAGLAPDLDVLIRSSKDPLMEVEFHRHFTHSLAFVPLGALIVAFACQKVFSRSRPTPSFLRFFVWAFFGYASHGVIDACTSYGTQLLWPFSNSRIAWNNVAIVDPVVTGLLGIGSVMLFRSKDRVRLWALTGLFSTIVYLLLGVVQRDRALQSAQGLAELRGHVPQRLVVKPTVLNNVLFRSIYEYQGVYFVDAVRVNWWGQAKLYSGIQVPVFDRKKHVPWLAEDSQQFQDLRRFSWFSDGYIFEDPDRPGWIGDLRFALLPNERDSLWWLILDPQADFKTPAKFIHDRAMTPDKPRILKAQILGT